MRKIRNVVILCILTMAIVITVCILLKNYHLKNKPIVNYVELKATYRNYIVEEKRNEDSIHLLLLRNPITKETSLVRVNDYIYYNLYFIGDTIK